MSTMNTSPMPLSILILARPGQFVAQCIENDIAVQAPGLDELRYQFFAALFTHALFDEDNGREPLAGIPRAPAKFERLFEKAMALAHGKFSPPEQLQRPPWYRDGNVDARLFNRASLAC